MSDEMYQVVLARESRRGATDLPVREVSREKFAFELAEKQFDRVRWLLLGLDFLAEWGLGIRVQLKQPAKSWFCSRKLMQDELLEAVGDAIRRDATDRADLEATGEDLAIYTFITPEQIAVTKAWVEQSTYLLWARVRLVEEALIDLVRDNVFEYASSDGVDPNTTGDKAWRDAISAWHDAHLAKTPDPLMVVSKR